MSNRPIRYEVYLHEHGRRGVRRGPMEGCLNFPEHRWTRLSRRPLGWAAARGLADAQPGHAVLIFAGATARAYDNGKAPAVPEGWWSPAAETALEPGLPPSRRKNGLTQLLILQGLAEIRLFLLLSPCASPNAG